MRKKKRRNTFVRGTPVVAEPHIIFEAAVEVERVVVGKDHLVTVCCQSPDRLVVKILQQKIKHLWWEL